MILILLSRAFKLLQQSDKSTKVAAVSIVVRLLLQNVACL